MWQQDSFVAMVPFWAVWPFEILLLARRHLDSLNALRDRERYDLAEMLKRIATIYDELFDAPFPYTMGFHQSSPHFHAHYYPPLLRSATIRKFMVGYEMLKPCRSAT